MSPNDGNLISLTETKLIAQGCEEILICEALRSCIEAGILLYFFVPLAHFCTHALCMNHVYDNARNDGHYHAYPYIHGGCQQKQIRHIERWQLLR
jgi:hypothetical protein